MRDPCGDTYRAPSNGNYCHFTAEKDKCGKNQPYFLRNGARWSKVAHLASKVHLSLTLAHVREHTHRCSSHLPCTLYNGKPWATGK